MLRDMNTVSSAISKDVIERVRVTQKNVKNRAGRNGLVTDAVPIFGIEDLGPEFEIPLESDDDRTPEEIFKEWFEGHVLDKAEKEKLN